MGSVVTKIASNGRVLIPAILRREANIGPDERVHMEARDGEIRILTYRTAVREAQEMIRRTTRPSKTRASDELIADRRREAKREAQKDAREARARARRSG